MGDSPKVKLLQPGGRYGVHPQMGKMNGENHHKKQVETEKISGPHGELEVEKRDKTKAAQKGLGNQKNQKHEGKRQRQGAGGRTRLGAPGNQNRKKVRNGVCSTKTQGFRDV